MRTHLVSIFFLLLSLGCTKHDESLLRSRTPVLIGLLKAGEPVSGVRFFTLGDKESSGYNTIQSASITLKDDLANEEVKLTQNGHSFEANNMLVEANRKYILTTEYDGQTINTECRIPPNVLLVNISQTNIKINPNTQGMPVSTVEWNELDNIKYSYALQLENLEDVKTEIPFELQGGNFESLYETPLLNNNLVLFDTDFKYYGHHRLTVYAIERSLESVFFYNSSDIRGLLQTGPDNIEGAQGYFAGVSSFSVDMLIE